MADRVPPSSWAHPPLGEVGLLFESADVTDLAAECGLPLKVAPSSIAPKLRSTFFRVDFWCAPAIPAPGDLREFYNRVSRDSRKLLDTLGMNERPEDAVKLYADPAMQSKLPALAHLVDFYDLSLFDAPRLVALLAQRADECRRNLEGLSAQPGNKEDLALKELFTRLAGCFADSFGCPPRLGPEKSRADADSTIWVESVLATAASRAPDRILLNLPEQQRSAASSTHPWVRKLEEANNLARSTKADRLAAGWSEWKSRAPNRQWGPEEC